MKAALLCNGPSRVAFKSRLGYNYVIGCNIPWTEVDSTVIFDVEVLNHMWEKSLTPVSSWVSFNAWRKSSNNVRVYIRPNMLGILEPNVNGDSSGHMAFRKLLELGYKEIDIYGCDSWFDSNISSYTHQYVGSREGTTNRNVKQWRVHWEKYIEDNPEVKITFIKGDNQ